MAVVYDKVLQPSLAVHDCAVLDLAFLMDCTASMGPYITEAKASVRIISEELSTTENCNVKFALVEYRDHPPQDHTFVTKVHDFEESITKVEEWLTLANSSGGGDLPEAVADALHESLKLSWRKDSTKILILIADAPPHGLIQNGDEFPKGCPLGYDPVEKVNELVQRDVTIYVVGCEPNIVKSKDFYSAMAFKTGGQYIPLKSAKFLSKVIIGGAREEIDLQKLLDEINKDVQAEYESQGDAFDLHAFTERRYADLRYRGVRTKQTCRKSTGGKAPLKKASFHAVHLSKYKNLDDVKKNMKEPKTSHSNSIFGEKMTKKNAKGGSPAKRKNKDARKKTSGKIGKKTAETLIKTKSVRVEKERIEGTRSSKRLEEKNGIVSIKPKKGVLTRARVPKKKMAQSKSKASRNVLLLKDEKTLEESSEDEDQGETEDINVEKLDISKAQVARLTNRVFNKLKKK